MIQKLGDREADEVRRLASYPADSAGGIMTTEAIALPETMTAEQAVAELAAFGQEVEQVYYVYAVDASERLDRRPVDARPDLRAAASTVERRSSAADVMSVPVAMDQEEVARVLRRHGYLALPVVDD